MKYYCVLIFKKNLIQNLYLFKFVMENIKIMNITCDVSSSYWNYNNGKNWFVNGLQLQKKKVFIFKKILIQNGSLKILISWV